MGLEGVVDAAALGTEAGGNSLWDPPLARAEDYAEPRAMGSEPDEDEGDGSGDGDLSSEAGLDDSGDGSGGESEEGSESAEEEEDDNDDNEDPDEGVDRNR